MDCLLLGDGKLKLTLSPDDMDTYGIDAGTLDWSDTGTRRAMWSLFDEVKRRCGFDAASSRIRVEVFPSRAGGCEIFVTRASREPAREVAFTGNVAPAGRHAYYFAEARDMIACCRALATAYGEVASSAYCDGRGYAMLFEHEYSMAREFGDYLGCSAEIGARLAEHAEPILTREAVATLSRL